MGTPSGAMNFDFALPATILAISATASITVFVTSVSSAPVIRLTSSNAVMVGKESETVPRANPPQTDHGGEVVAAARAFGHGDASLTDFAVQHRGEKIFYAIYKGLYVLESHRWLPFNFNPDGKRGYP